MKLRAFYKYSKFIVIFIVVIFLCILYNIRNNFVELFQGNNRNYKVELICNVSKETERIEKLGPILDLFNITPSYSVDKSDVERHELYNKFSKVITKSEASLYINHIVILKNYSDKGKYVLIFESDVKPLKELNSIESDLNTLVEQMTEKNIDIVFIGKGHLPYVNTSEYQKLTDTLYRVNSSRCTEAYMVSPRFIEKYLEYFDNTDNHVSIDHDYNNFFKATDDIVVAWRIPELFEQDGSVSTIIEHTKY